MGGSKSLKLCMFKYSIWYNVNHAILQVVIWLSRRTIFLLFFNLPINSLHSLIIRSWLFAGQFFLDLQFSFLFHCHDPLSFHSNLKAFIESASDAISSSIHVDDTPVFDIIFARMSFDFCETTSPKKSTTRIASSSSIMIMTGRFISANFAEFRQFFHVLHVGSRALKSPLSDEYFSREQETQQGRTVWS